VEILDAMPNLLSQILDGPPQNTSAEYLAFLGKQAAIRFLDANVPLNQGVLELVCDSSLSGEHIRRVCEFANHSVNHNLFEKAAALRDGQIVYPKFPLADAETILAELGREDKIACALAEDYVVPPRRSEGLSKVAVAGGGVLEFNHPVRQRDSPHAFDVCNATLDAVRSIRFAVTLESSREFIAPPSQEKQAGALALDTIWNTRAELRENLERLYSMYGDLQGRSRDAWETFYSGAKQAALDGVPLPDVANVVCQLAGDDAGTIIAKLAGRLVGENVISPPSAEELAKTSSVRPLNPTNGMNKSCAAYISFEREMVKIAAIQDELSRGLERINRFLRSRYAL